jgi:MinD superfamily P-loop ATPase
VSIVLNRFSGFDGNLSERLVRERLGRPVTHVVPYDRNFVVAATRGRPLVSGRLAPSLQVPLSSIADDAAGTRRAERGVMR